MKIFDNPKARYVLRAILVGIAAAVSSISSGGSTRDVIIAGFGSLLAYAGVGAAVPAVEPNVGLKKTPAPAAP